MLIDILCVLIVLYGLYLGFTRGVVRALLMLATVILALVLALKISPLVANGLEDLFGSLSFAWLILSFVFVFIVAYWGISWLARLIDRTLRVKSLKVLNKILGGMILGLFFLLCYSLLLGFLDHAGLISDKAKANAKTWDIIKATPGKGEALLDATKPLFREFWDKVNQTTE